MGIGNYSIFALSIERKLDPRVLEAIDAPRPGVAPLLIDFALRVLRNLDQVEKEGVGYPVEDLKAFHSAIIDLAEDLRRQT